jgi:hypothetical protein
MDHPAITIEVNVHYYSRRDSQSQDISRRCWRPKMFATAVYNNFCANFRIADDPAEDAPLGE